MNEGSVAAGGAATGSPGEQLSRRCVLLLKAALKPDVWPHLCEPKLAWLDKVSINLLYKQGRCKNIIVVTIYYELLIAYDQLRKCKIAEI